MIELFFKMPTMAALWNDLDAAGFPIGAHPGNVEIDAGVFEEARIDGTYWCLWRGGQWNLVRPSAVIIANPDVVRVDIGTMIVMAILARNANGSIRASENKGLHANMRLNGSNAATLARTIFNHYELQPATELSTTEALRTAFNVKRQADNPQPEDTVVPEIRQAANGSQIFVPRAGRGDQADLNARKFMFAE